MYFPAANCHSIVSVQISLDSSLIRWYRFGTSIAKTALIIQNSIRFRDFLSPATFFYHLYKWSFFFIGNTEVEIVGVIIFFVVCIFCRFQSGNSICFSLQSIFTQVIRVKMKYFFLKLSFFPTVFLFVCFSSCCIDHVSLAVIRLIDRISRNISLIESVTSSVSQAIKKSLA